MKAKSKIIVSAILAIALCVSLIAGTTFALFTSEDSVNIAVTAGNVEVEAGLSLVSTASDGVTNATVGSFATGGTAKVVGKELTLSNVVPGDSATVKISLTNKSTVAISYRVNVAIKGKLAEVLTVSGVQDGKGEWKKLGAKEAIEDGIDLTVAFPHGDNDNNYMGERGSVTITVEAVQGNAAVEQVYVSNADELLTALANDEVQVIGLRKGIYDFTDKSSIESGKGLAITRPVTLIGAGEGTVIKVGTGSVSNAISGQAYVYITSSNVTVSDMTIESVQTADTTQTGSKQFRDTVKISATNLDENGQQPQLSNVTLRNVDIVGTTANGLNIHNTKDVVIDNVSVSGTMRKCAVSVAESENVTFDGCSLSNGSWGAVGLMYDDSYKGGSSVTFNDCSVGSVYEEHPAGQSVNTVVGLEDRIVYPINDNQTAYVPAANLNGVKYKSLQEAISNANNGDVITLSSGTFVEPISVEGKNITIKGSNSVITFNAESTFTKFDAVAGEGQGYLGIVVAKDATLALEGVTILGNVSAAAGLDRNYRYAGVNALDSDVTLTNCAVNDITYGTGILGIQNGNAIYAVSSTAKTLTLNNVVVENFSKTGVLTRANVTLKYNGGSVKGIGETTAIAQNGIQYSGAADIRNITISDIGRYTGPNTSSTIALFAYPINNASSTIDNVTIDNCEYDITVYSAGTVTVTNSNIENVNYVGGTLTIDGKVIPQD